MPEASVSVLQTQFRESYAQAESAAYRLLYDLFQTLKTERVTNLTINVLSLPDYFDYRASDSSLWIGNIFEKPLRDVLAHNEHLVKTKMIQSGEWQIKFLK